MELTPFGVWLLLKLDTFSGFFFFLALLCVFVAVVSMIIAADNKDENGRAFCVRLIKTFLIIGAISLVSGILCPTTEQAVKMYILPMVVNNKDLQETISKSPKILNELMEYAYNEIKSQNAKNETK